MFFSHQRNLLKEKRGSVLSFTLSTRSRDDHVIRLIVKVNWRQVLHPNSAHRKVNFKNNNTIMFFLNKEQIR